MGTIRSISIAEGFLRPQSFPSAVSPEPTPPEETATPPPPRDSSSTSTSDTGETADGSVARRSADGEGNDTPETADRGLDGEELTPEEVEQVRLLEREDQRIRRHEQAHVAAGGPHVLGGPTYQYTTGPDGRRYAVSGQVQIDLSEEPQPEQTIAKMQVVRRAALAPADPSAQDRRVAAEASQREAQARVELAVERQEEFANGPPTEEESGADAGPLDSTDARPNATLAERRDTVMAAFATDEPVGRSLDSVF